MPLAGVLNDQGNISQETNSGNVLGSGNQKHVYWVTEREQLPLYHWLHSQERDGGFDQAIQVCLSKPKIIPPWGSGFSNNKVSCQSKPILELFYASIPEYSTLPSDSTSEDRMAERLEPSPLKTIRPHANCYIVHSRHIQCAGNHYSCLECRYHPQCSRLEHTFIVPEVLLQVFKQAKFGRVILDTTKEGNTTNTYWYLRWSLPKCMNMHNYSMSLTVKWLPAILKYTYEEGEFEHTCTCT